MSPRGLQERVAAWVVACLGVRTLNDRSERALRLLEESAEFAQAQGIEAWQARKLLERVYSRPAGDPLQELGGVGVTFLACCESVDVAWSRAVRVELQRIKNPVVMDRCRAKQQEKTAAGVVGPDSRRNP